MTLAYYTDSLGHLPFIKMLDTVKKLGVTSLEFGTGNWSSAPHLNLDDLLSSEAKRSAFLTAISTRGLQICALNCSGNPLANNQMGKLHMETTKKTFLLAKLLGVTKIVMMSGLPCGCEGDSTPVWVTTSWPPENAQILTYQWDAVAIPAWKKLVSLAEDCGITRIAIENHPYQLVYNPQTLLRLREAVGDLIGINLDPSHLFWMNGDPIAAARALKGCIYHVHGKDSRIERVLCAQNGVLDTSPIKDYASRSWNFVAVGCGHDLQWWREFFSVLRMCGYDEAVSLEMEDMSMSPLDGVTLSIKTLLNCI